MKKVTFKELEIGTEFVLPHDVISKGDVIFKKVKGRRGVWTNLATDEDGRENVVNPDAEVLVIKR